MTSRFSTHASASILALAMTAWSLSGCSDSAPADPEPAPKVDVPTIEGAVAAGDFCGLADQISCAGAVGCCSAAEPPYASADECIQASTCEQNMGKMLQSSLISDGTITYDADLAGDYLRALASRISGCGAPDADTANPIFLVGTRAEGEDCSPAGSDKSNLFSCKPGLVCALSMDEMTGVETGACQPASPPSTSGKAGDACASDEDCRSGPCEEGKCAFDVSSFYCGRRPAEEAPSNAAPTHMYIKVHDSSEAGSSGDITVKYVAGTMAYSCTITETLNRNAAHWCAATSESHAEGSSIYMNTSSGDGLRVATVCACNGIDTTGKDCAEVVQCSGTFFDYGNNDSWSEGCSWDPSEWGHWCSNVWLDKDGHGSCSELKVNYNNHNYTNCD